MSAIAADVLTDVLQDRSSPYADVSFCSRVSVHVFLALRMGTMPVVLTLMILVDGTATGCMNNSCLCWKRGLRSIMP